MGVLYQTELCMDETSFGRKGQIDCISHRKALIIMHVEIWVSTGSANGRQAMYDGSTGWLDVGRQGYARVRYRLAQQDFFERKGENKKKEEEAWKWKEWNGWRYATSSLGNTPKTRVLLSTTTIRHYNNLITSPSFKNTSFFFSGTPLRPLSQAPAELQRLIEKQRFKHKVGRYLQGVCPQHELSTVMGATNAENDDVAQEPFPSDPGEPTPSPPLSSVFSAIEISSTYPSTAERKQRAANQEDIGQKEWLSSSSNFDGNGELPRLQGSTMRWPRWLAVLELLADAVFCSGSSLCRPCHRNTVCTKF